MRIEEVARRAGVSKATIYRWWPSKELLALDAVATDSEYSLPSTGSDTGSLRGDLLERMEALSGMSSKRPLGPVVAGLVAQAQSDPGFATVYFERYFAPRREIGRRIFRRAIQRGEIPADTDVDVALDLLYGALAHRKQHRHAPLDDDFVRKAIDVVIGGLQRPRAGSSEPAPR
jgi:AcrR family transcriptional regulator